MCGITGIVRGESFDTNVLAAMTDAIAHRGPDDAGMQIWSDHGVGLGHRRLSIIDLSPAGHNPMPNEDGTVWIVFNGEIYNFRSLRQELERAGHIFRSNTDTEVILHAYEEWGDEHIHRLRGMFAYALYDRRPTTGARKAKRNFRLLLVRDRLGIKPLFYYWHAKTFLFASEIKAILAHPGIDRTLDRSALFDYLTYLYVPAPKTAYLHIRKLLPGHYLVLEDECIDVRQYWDVPLDQPSPVCTIDAATELVRHTLEEVVRLHMVSDVPVGVFLSGGMDSSSITALMTQATTEPPRTFSIGFDVAEHSETWYARLVAEYYRTRHSERTVDGDSVESMLSRMVLMYDEPYADSSATPTYRVSSMAREYVKVVLSGDGGDEIFAGYNWYSTWLARRYIDWIPLPLRRRAFSAVARGWPRNWRGRYLLSDMAKRPLERYARLMELFSPFEKQQLLTSEWAEEFADYDDYWYFRRYWHEELDPLTRIQYLDLKTYLPDDILTKVDRASMAVSLEVRPPLLDHILVEQLFSLPAAWRMPHGQKKYLFKRAMGDLLPNVILNRSKKGFSSPLTPWMYSRQDWVKQQLKRHVGLGLLRKDVADMPWLFERGAKVWGVLLLQEWLSGEVQGASV
jgi:asparagine synthase (glutamine-hydrolysing)